MHQVTVTPAPSQQPSPRRLAPSTLAMSLAWEGFSQRKSCMAVVGTDGGGAEHGQKAAFRQVLSVCAYSSTGAGGRRRRAGTWQPCSGAVCCAAQASIQLQLSGDA